MNINIDIDPSKLGTDVSEIFKTFTDKEKKDREWLEQQLEGYLSDDMNEAAIKGEETGYEIGLKSGYKKGFEAGKKAALQWQDISTAPKDGNCILLFCEDWQPKIAQGCWEYIEISWDEVGNSYWGWAADYVGDFCEPTHWMPLPAAPEVSE